MVRKPEKGKRQDNLSLHPLEFDEAVSGILKVKPKERQAQESNMTSKERKGITCFNKQEADEQREKFQRDGFRVKVVKHKDGKYTVYPIGEPGKWPS